MAVNPEGPEPLHVQIADALKAEMRSGQLPAGSKIPSTRKLADRFDVSGMTAVQAIRSLRDEGLVFTTQRGSFVADPDADVAGETSEHSPEFIEITRVLTALDEQVQTMAEQLAELQETVRRIAPTAKRGK